MLNEELVKDHKLILIVYYGRSGSVFMHSLLDGHPEIISMPPVLMNFIEAIELDKPNLENPENAYRYFISLYGPLINSNEYFPSQDFVRKHSKSMNFKSNTSLLKKVFKQNFYYYFRNLMHTVKDKRKLLFLTMHYAYDATLNDYQDIEIAESKKIVFQLHNPVFTFINWYAELFDGVALLQMVRSPLVALRSLAVHWIELGRFTSIDVYNILMQMLFGATLFDYNKVDHFAVKLEDIHCQPEFTLRKIAQRLQIDWNDSLLTSTFAGLPWGNLKDRDHISGFMPKPKPVDLTDIIPIKDQACLLPTLKRRYQSWGYELPIIKNSCTPSSENHTMLLEYLAYIENPKAALEQYNKQSLLFNSERMQFYMRYGSRFNQPLVEVL